MKLTYPSRSELPSNVEIPVLRGKVLIGGKLLDSGFGTRKVVSPCTILDDQGKPHQPEIGQTPNVSPEYFLKAVDAAQDAWAKGRGDWPSARMEHRIRAITTLRDRIAERRELIVRLLMWEIAKTRADAEAEFDRTIVYITDTLEATKSLDREGSRVQFAGDVMAQIRRTPLGVTLCMGPFNYPFNETFATLVPALIMGNVVIVKPPRFGKLLWDVLNEPFREALPPGVINVVNGAGNEVISPAVKSGKIDVLAFIGSSRVANTIKQSHPEPHHFRSILGLDAKNPAIVLNDAHLETAVAECLKGSLSFNGQRCTALKILFVQKGLSAKFIEAFSAKVNAMKPGLPWDAGVSVTGLPDPYKPEQLKNYLSEAVGQGARLANGPQGGAVDERIFFPAVVSGVPLHSSLAIEEQFGPIVPIVEFDRVSEVEDYVVQSPYGMQASVFGNDPKQLGGLIDILSNQVSRINLNSQCQRGPDVFPFTGRKRSAEGTLSVTDALRSFSIRSMVTAKQDAQGKQVLRSIMDGDHSQFLTTNIVL